MSGAELEAEGSVIESWSRKDQSGGRGDEEKRVVEIELAGLTMEDAGQGVT